jgi:hypothetical protein
MAIIERVFVVDWGVTGEDLYYVVEDVDHVDLVARTNENVEEYPSGSGQYRIVITNWNTAWAGTIIWDNDDGVNYAQEDFVPITGSVVGTAFLPLSAVVSEPYRVSKKIRVLQNSTPDLAWTVVDDNSDPVDLTAKTLRFVAYTEIGDTQTVIFVHENADFTVSGADSNIATLSLDLSDTDTPRTMLYVLWDLTANVPLTMGTLDVLRAPQSAP